jgi:GntR family transcriptional regulator of arabinose operon
VTIPVYQTIINTIQEWIQKGKFQSNDKLPSETQLMEEFSTSRITVIRALKEMELKGIIYRLKGKGSFVAEEKPRYPSEGRVISLVLPHKVDFFSGGQQYAHQIYSSCQERGYLCSLHYSDQSTRKERQILEEIEGHNVAGAIIYPISNRNAAILSRMSIKGFPMVLLDRKLEELSIPVVTSDNFQGALKAVTYLAERGHKRIGFIGAKDSDVVSERYRGYCYALTDSGIPMDMDLLITQFTGNTEDERSQLDENEALHILKKLRKKNISAIFCVNDLIAYRLLMAAQKLNISVPEELSLVGFDNLKYMDDTSWKLTTVAQDFESIARGCVSILVDMIEKGVETHVEDMIVPTRFLKGNTLG